MKPKSLKLLTTATLLIVCSSLTLGLAFLGFIFNRSSEDATLGTNSSAAVEFELGLGMGPNLMTPQSFKSNDELIDMINAEFENRWIAGPTVTRRYMSALIAGEGCKSYVDYGDGKWVLVDHDTTNLNDPHVPDDPFGDGSG
ncbi:MAG: hypothetical protein SFV81_28605 [Pirellulaceae bacterium]|nr:hypothetical protein [Pirellulaceae bacterium]